MTLRLTVGGTYSNITFSLEGLHLFYLFMYRENSGGLSLMYRPTVFAFFALFNMLPSNSICYYAFVSIRFKQIVYCFI